MKIRFQQPRGQRVKGKFIGVETDSGQRWCSDRRKWIFPSSGDAFFGNDCHLFDGAPRTVRGFNRYIRSHPELQGRVTFISRYVDHDAYTKIGE